MKPNQINILGKVYSVSYVDRPSDVDIRHQRSLWGQIDYWDRSIRIYDRGRQDSDLLHTILHEVIHGITEELNLGIRDDEDQIDLLALGLADVLDRNGWLREEPW